jgi:hypothetical protein
MYLLLITVGLLIMARGSCLTTFFVAVDTQRNHVRESLVIFYIRFLFDTQIQIRALELQLHLHNKIVVTHMLALRAISHDMAWFKGRSISTVDPSS